MSKVCTKCKLEKLETEFIKRSRSTDGLASWCKACTRKLSKKLYDSNLERERARGRSRPFTDELKATRQRYAVRNKEKIRIKHIIRKYGISAEKYEQMISSQNGCCALCSEKAESLVIDHNHKTGKVRALLCHKCNLGLGQFRESPETLIKAIQYLDHFKE